MGFSVEPARLEQAQALYALEQRCFDGDQLGLRSFKRLIQSPSAHVLVIADETAGIAGYALVLTRKNSGWWRIYSVAIAPEHRGKGLSRQLMDSILKHAKETGATGVRLEVKVSNHSAIQLYRDYHFEVTDVLTAYYEDGSDGYRMQRSF